MTDLPAGLREALTEADLRWDCPGCGRGYPLAFPSDLAPVLMSWLAVHDVEVRQQGRNEAAQAIFAALQAQQGYLTPDQAANIAHDTYARLARRRVARGGSDLKGQDNG